MQTKMKTNLVKMSLAAALLLSTSAYAGKIVGVEANTPYTAQEPPMQYGFGSWDLGNINVKMTDLDYNQTSKTFNTNGTYDAMTYGDAFMSEILNSTDNPVGMLIGAQWPIAEPAGIKVLNNDMDNQENTVNCIMATTYQTGAYLDSAEVPLPTTCVSEDGETKSFEVNILQEAVNNYDGSSRYGQPIDLVFNLDGTDKSNDEVRYKVYQAVSNYTDMRLDGYKIEVLRKNEMMFPLLTFGAEPHSITNSTFSEELWGDSNDSFFDNKEAGFAQKANDKSTFIKVTSTLGSNYADIFGLWLPAKWLPYGIFHNDEGENELVAFWGDPMNTGTNAWHRGNNYDEEDGIEPWALVTEEELAAMNLNEEGSAYSIAKIEDTTRLELNYEVDIGVNSAIGEQFTIRLTPRVAEEELQTPPSYIDENGTYILPPQVTEEEPPVGPAPGPEPTADAGPDMTVVVNTPVTITGSGDDVDGTIVAYEWKWGDTILASTASFEFTPTIAGVATLTLTVTDNDGLTGSDSMVLTVTEEDGTVPETPGDILTSGGGGGCSYNPNSHSFDAMFLLMVALGVLYPLRRIILKEEK